MQGSDVEMQGLFEETFRSFVEIKDLVVEIQGLFSEI